MNGAQGVYFFGSQCLYWENPGQSNQGLCSYYQFGASNSPFVITQRFFGCGLTYFGPLPRRDDDSCGFAMAWANLTYIPNPARVADTPAAFPFTLQATMLF